MCCEMQMQAPDFGLCRPDRHAWEFDPNIDATMDANVGLRGYGDLRSNVQAWRQLKAVYRAMPARLRRNATLVVTHVTVCMTPNPRTV